MVWQTRKRDICRYSAFAVCSKILESALDKRKRPLDRSGLWGSAGRYYGDASGFGSSVRSGFAYLSRQGIPGAGQRSSLDAAGNFSGVQLHQYLCYSAAVRFLLPGDDGGSKQGLVSCFCQKKPGDFMGSRFAASGGRAGFDSWGRRLPGGETSGGSESGAL